MKVRIKKYEEASSVKSNEALNRMFFDNFGGKIFEARLYTDTHFQVYDKSNGKWFQVSKRNSEIIGDSFEF